jgi:putative N6-adenine-specific DNA methylase
MPDNKKTGTLRLTAKPLASDGPRTATQGERHKSGARAHQRTRLQTEQRHAKTTPAAPSAPATPRVTSRPSSQSSDTKGNHERDTSARSGRFVQRQTTNQRSSAVAQGPDKDEVFTVFAPCPKGLEQALARELIALGFGKVQVGSAGCQFDGHWHDVWRANLQSRLATRILVQLSHAPIRSEDDLRALALDTEWERWFAADQTLRVDTSAIRSPMQSLQFCNLLVKDSICDRLRSKQGARPSIDTVRPDVRVHSFLSADHATLYLDTSGESLFKRGWRLDKTEAPIRENLAAGLLALSGWQADLPLFDPFCGSGTILIEAAWQALGIAPGINRPFAFERLRLHDRQAWQDMRRQATESVKDSLDIPLVGSDLSTDAIDAAKANMKRAGLKSDLIQWQVADATTAAPPSAPGLILTNPPYGQRLAVDDDLMPRWAAQLKRHYAQWHVNIISADLDLPRALRLKPKRRTPVYNGALDCRLFIFEMVSDQYRT